MSQLATDINTPPASSGPIAELIRYYDRLVDDDDALIPEYGFSTEKIHACLVINADGSQPTLEDIRERTEKGKPIPRTFLLPNSGGRSGTSIQPNFMWDNTGYVLGVDDKGKPDRAAKMFGEFLHLHQSIAEQINDCDELAAVVAFLKSWDPVQAESFANWEELIGTNVVFQVRGRTHYVHELDAIKQFWSTRQREQVDSGEDVVRGISLFDGESKPLARLHPQVQGVVGANPTGAALVSFNKDSFKSYRKDQSFNSPLGVLEAFKYTTALQSLLADPGRRFRVGDSTVVFWTDSPSPVDSDLAVQIFNDPPPPKKPSAEHAGLIGRLQGFICDAASGLVTDNVRNPDANYYILGLSPSTSRLSTRFWMTGSVQELGRRLQAHLDDVAIVGLATDRIPMARSMLYQSVRDAKEISPQLAGETMRSILTGGLYPSPLLGAIVRRCRTNRSVRTMQAAILKACLIRRDRVRGTESAINPNLNPDHPATSYQLGRLLAVLDLAHLGATDGRVNPSTAVSRLSLAATNPVLVFPELLRLHQHHCRKLPLEDAEARRRKTRTRRTFDSLRNDAMWRIAKFPSSLACDDQALFLLGFYQQNQAYFNSSVPSVDSTTSIKETRT